ncbi:MAG: hypothetical protein ACLPSW_03510, partial [Roseiarcus sp.]
GASEYSFPALERAKTSSQDRSRKPSLNTENQTRKGEPNICEQDLIDVVEVEDQAGAAASPIAPLGARELEREFEKFWVQCQGTRRVAKGSARKAYLDVVNSGKASPVELLHGMMKYAGAWQDKKDRRFIRTPANWLNQECWNDDPEAIAPDNPWSVVRAGLRRVAEAQQAFAGYAVDQVEKARACRQGADLSEAPEPEPERPRPGAQDQERWARVKIAVGRQFRTESFDTFLRDASLEAIEENGECWLGIYDALRRSLGSRYIDALLEAWRAEMPSIRKIAIMVRRQAPDRRAAAMG